MLTFSVVRMTWAVSRPDPSPAGPALGPGSPCVDSSVTGEEARLTRPPLSSALPSSFLTPHPLPPPKQTRRHLSPVPLESAGPSGTAHLGQWWGLTGDVSHRSSHHGAFLH